VFGFGFIGMCLGYAVIALYDRSYLRIIAR